MSSSRQIEQRAAAWLAKRDGAEWSAGDADALGEWLAASTAHKVAFIRLEAAWKESARLKALGAGVPEGVIPEPGNLHRSLFFRRGMRRPRAAAAAVTSAPAPALVHRRSYAALAAGVLLAAGLAAAWILRPQGTEYRTAVGGVQSVPMTDGSQVTLNTDTDIRVSVTDKERRVDLRRGEAFFEVASDPTRPFVVRAGEKRVVAVGTKFSVRRDDGQVRVLVTEGKVRLESAGEGASAPATLVSAGNLARTEPTGVLVAPEAPAESEAALSWRRGYLVFHETPIADAVAEFNRYNTRKIVVEDPAVAAIRIGGNFRSTSSDAFVRLLSDGFPIRVEERGDEILLTHQ